MKFVALCLAIAALPAAAAAQSWQVTITGMVARATTMSAADLEALKQVDLAGSFESMSGRQTHKWTGPLLLDVLDHAGMIDEPGKRTHMRHAFLARGSDGYAVAVAIGEIDPKGEGKRAVVALTQDGTKLKAPRLVVPGDSSFTRSVHDLVEIKVN
jgi:DMSO/TMAO reductase YedYZ molybdopterin-dependent catalytic subunit